MASEAFEPIDYFTHISPNNGLSDARSNNEVPDYKVKFENSADDDALVRCVA